MANSFTDHLKGVMEAVAARTALEFPQRSYTYRELALEVQRALGLFSAMNIEAGDRVATALETSPEAVVFHLASLFSGSIHVPINPRYTEPEIGYILDDTRARLFVRHGPACGPAGSGQRAVEILERTEEGRYEVRSRAACLEGLLDRVGPAGTLAPDRRDTDVALICFTSGTTGRPKGAMLTYGNLFAGSRCLWAAWGWRSDDVLLHALPLFHIHGLLVALHGALFAGAKAILEPGFDAARILGRLARGEATIFMGVPTMYNRMVAVPDPEAYRLETVRLLTSGSAPLSAETFRAFQRLYGHTVLERYGMTETGIVLSNPLEAERRPGSVGMPLSGVEVRLVDPEGRGPVPEGVPGEILVRGPTVFKGYWQRDEETHASFKEGGWFRTGDLARQDRDGYFYLVGRRKELIITGGFNVYPREVEEVLLGHEAVEEAAVMGEPDPDLGERVVAAVACKQGGSGVSSHALLAYCRERLAGYKCPRQVYILSSLPKNEMGKVCKDRVRSLVKGGRGDVLQGEVP